MIKQFRKKPVVIEALEYTGDNWREVREWCGDYSNNRGVMRGHFEVGDIPTVYIVTLEGEMKVSIGDYVIKGINGEFYPCKPDIFKKTYEEVK